MNAALQIAVQTLAPSKAAREHLSHNPFPNWFSAEGISPGISRFH